MQNKKMGFFSLLMMCLGNMIGSAIFALLPIVMGMTGKSISLACVVGAVLCLLITCVPAIFLSSTVDLPGGSYSQGAVMFPPILAGISGLFQIVGYLTFAGSVISLTVYIVQLIPGLSDLQKLVSFILLICFFLLGVKGVSVSANFQNIIVVVLLLSLASYIIGGLPHVDFGTYFSDNYFAGGSSGFMQASALMMSCSLGGNMILSFTSEAKNAKRDIPAAMLVGTLIVGLIYFLIGVVSSGIVPIENVTSAMNLGVVAESFMSGPFYMFFMIGGAMFALGSTVNGMLAALPYPILQMAQDGWLPKAFLKRDKKFNYPYVVMGAAFLIGGVLPIFFGLNISDIVVLICPGTYVICGITAFFTMTLPKKFPNRWKKSTYHVPNIALYVILTISAVASFFVAYQFLLSGGVSSVIVTVCLLIVISLYCLYRVKSGKVNLSYLVFEDVKENENEV